MYQSAVVQFDTPGCYKYAWLIFWVLCLNHLLGSFCFFCLFFLIGRGEFPARSKIAKSSQCFLAMYQSIETQDERHWHWKSVGDKPFFYHFLLVTQKNSNQFIDMVFVFVSHPRMTGIAFGCFCRRIVYSPHPSIF